MTWIVARSVAQLVLVLGIAAAIPAEVLADSAAIQERRAPSADPFIFLSPQGPQDGRPPPSIWFVTGEVDRSFFRLAPTEILRVREATFATILTRVRTLDAHHPAPPDDAHLPNGAYAVFYCALGGCSTRGQLEEIGAFEPTEACHLLKVIADLPEVVSHETRSPTLDDYAAREGCAPKRWWEH